MSKERDTGIVKWFSREKGYGFIRLADGEDVFVHHSDIEGDGFKTLRQGERVEFEITASDRGPKARNIVRLEGGENGDGEHPDGTPASRPERRSGRNARVESAPQDREKEPGTLSAQLRSRLGRRFPWLAR